MKKQKLGEKPRPLYQRMLFFLLKIGGVGLLGIGIYLLYSLSVFWQLERRSAELPGLHLYSVQESNYTKAFSWYASYPKIDEPAFDTAVAKIANDAKGVFLARVNFQAKNAYPTDDLNVSYTVDSYGTRELSITLTSQQVVKGKLSSSVKKVTYDRQRQKIKSIVSQKAMPQIKSATVVRGDIPKADGVDCVKQRCIALTFNDGPSPVTLKVLDTLKSNDAKATFFEVGAQAKLYPQIAKRTAKDGHVIGSLGMNHRNMVATPFAEVVNDINQGQAAIASTTGDRPGLLRAPYGSVTKSLVKKLGMPVIGWNLDAKDNVLRQPDAIYKSVMDKVAPGMVVVSRDTQQATADAYGRIIPDLIKRGYHLVTVPQLLDFNGNEQPGMYGN